MRQNVIPTVLITVTTTIALYAQINTGGLGKCALGNSHFNYSSQLQNGSSATSTKLIGYAGTKLDVALEWKALSNSIDWNKGASCNPSTHWIDDVCITNKKIKKMLWKDGEMQTPTNTMGTQISLQFEFIDTKESLLKQLGSAMIVLYFDRTQLEKDKNRPNQWAHKPQ